MMFSHHLTLTNEPIWRFHMAVKNNKLNPTPEGIRPLYVLLLGMDEIIESYSTSIPDGFPYYAMSSLLKSSFEELESLRLSCVEMEESIDSQVAT